MIRVINSRRWVVLPVLAIFSAELNAVPTGLKPVPNDVKIPLYKGRALPVHLLASEDSDAHLYVVPGEGVFRSEGVVASPLADCDLVKGEAKITRLNQRVRTNIAEMLVVIQAEHESNLERHGRLVRGYETLAAQVEPLKAQLERLANEHQEVQAEAKRIKSDIQGLREEKSLEEEKDKLADLDGRIKALEKDLKDKKRTVLQASKELRKAQQDFDDFSNELAVKKGMKTGLEKTLLVQMDDIQKIMDQLDKIDGESEKVLSRFSEREGGIATLTGDFAPVDYLAALKKANPEYQFQYVPSVTATVSTSIPETLLPGSPLAGKVGSLIRGASWTDKETGAENRKFQSKLLSGPAPEGTDPIKLAQRRIPELQSSLVGLKYISLDLSVLGYCAMKEPASLSSEFTAGVSDTFKLALQFTYPVNYALKVNGEFSSKDTLYEFHKITKSSSWFGLKKSQKQEYIRRIAHDKFIGVSVKPLGGDFQLFESMDLVNKVKEQLLFFVVQPYLNFDTMPELGKPQLDENLGARAVASRLSMIPSPWTFWGGLVLSSLADLFGSAESEATRDMSTTKDVKLSYDAGFNMLHAVSLTIGDLKD